MNLQNIDINKLPSDVRAQYFSTDLKFYMLKKRFKEKHKNDFMSFVKAVWPEFIEGAHHRVIAKKFNDLSRKVKLID